MAIRTSSTDMGKAMLRHTWRNSQCVLHARESWRLTSGNSRKSHETLAIERAAHRCDPRFPNRCEFHKLAAQQALISQNPQSFEAPFLKLFSNR
jgi:hypothetical protein